ncbi:MULTISPECIES: Nif3-like dinuclear metal center hexameric protein [Calothrix]|uniref:GTP cyclohydrolase 1 type 2 homolog n=2 Tax=Calothrix TaxID=1186 RepID=A0ABR8ALY7_9CYAN|nr:MULTISPECIES: Nif3-like dinuclear metal center hexameric protein [Calothrix]MBD2200565.1 Nif3-like dinuclear metal center hexameric protein [Calothrix parietina FACHB-288]MBD2229603.1 Nif3-like dinuclear metal center hexameric protein [Calothrix anomala FACHB-343]
MILKSTSLFLEEIEEFLNSLFHVEQFPESERGGIYLQSSNSIERLGLALEPGTHLDEWIIEKKLDALFLHRPWKLEIDKLPPRLGIISYHLPFDECLTVGFNIQLAPALQMSNIEILGIKENRAIGMIGDIQTQSFFKLCDCITQIFGKYEQLLPAANRDIKRIAVVGAMTDSLVREAAKRGADIYITGQIRQPAQKAIQETKIGAIAVGHRRSEIWGLRSLAGILQERWPNLQVFIGDES